MTPVTLESINKLHPGVRVLIALIPLIIILLVFYFAFSKPKYAQIKKLKSEIKKLDSEIADAQKMVEQLPALKAKLAMAEKEYEQIKRQLPEESEISSLLKMVSDQGRYSGLKINLWEPKPKSNHPSNIVYVIPVNVSMNGSYHELGNFLSRLTALDRIVNISQIKLDSPTFGAEEVSLKIQLVANTFSAIPEPDAKGAPGTAAK
ncbi:MAG: type 4a pilus biogenesis protein PilO [Nitrospirae bacterium]|uniref:type 4a pilus biogenesis protein PilO n=1 Tax=Candidatus Magnetobacterium casense TaxID=1455061 RepID=UPI00058E39F5|nr:type 4a pilus biogenesis protein PilO [Candidatus Magnetobacterium casensis]MBF0337120.1 type 4a pilus biogenesis protein PilO [Nitrospirota bacterium]